MFLCAFCMYVYTPVGKLRTTELKDDPLKEDILYVLPEIDLSNYISRYTITSED